MIFTITTGGRLKAASHRARNAQTRVDETIHCARAVDVKQHAALRLLLLCSN